MENPPAPAHVDVMEGDRLLLTKRQAAFQLSVSVRQLERWLAEDELKAVRIGSIVRIQPAELEAFVHRHSGARTWPRRRSDRMLRRSA